MADDPVTPALRAGPPAAAPAGMDGARDDPATRARPAATAAQARRRGGVILYGPGSTVPELPRAMRTRPPLSSKTLCWTLPEPGAVLRPPELKTMPLPAAPGAIRRPAASCAWMPMPFAGGVLQPLPYPGRPGHGICRQCRASAQDFVRSQVHLEAVAARAAFDPSHCVLFTLLGETYERRPAHRIIPSASCGQAPATLSRGRQRPMTGKGCRCTPAIVAAIRSLTGPAG